MVHYLKKNEPSLSELRKCLSLAFGKQHYIAVRMSKPRPQLRRNKSSRVGYSNFHLFVITRRTPKHKKDWSVLLCIQDQSVTKHSTKLNQQINSYCLSRERLLIQMYIRRQWIEPRPCCLWSRYTHSTEKSFYGTVAGSVTRLKAVECTFFSSFAHKLHNDPSYHMNTHAAGVEYIRNNRQRFIGPITEQLWVCCSNMHGVMHLLWKQFPMH